jgi:hypothetical protein
VFSRLGDMSVVWSFLYCASLLMFLDIPNKVTKVPICYPVSCMKFHFQTHVEYSRHTDRTIGNDFMADLCFNLIVN